ncbi:MAG TPA: DUF1998 domain-containing protein [Thermoanaerobaculia bacterium]|nr:DUF1998 domain-containing protein [Thermoanaerobaculia bacterium]HQN06588.1 DUF1998 domain-containing protein [Thermoanaerobaculia bacterium]
MKKRHHGEIRRSQLVRTFGPGAMVDLPNHSVVVSGLDSWFPASEMPTIVEERLSLKVASVLGHGKPVPLKGPPVVSDDERTPATGVPAFQFPEWFVVQVNAKRRPLVHLESLDKGKYEVDRKKVPAVPVRFVQACVLGHLSDIDWRGFIHMYRGDCSRPIWMEERGSSGDLADVVVGCDCGAERSMAQATRRGAESLGECAGRRPWLGRHGGERCGGENGKRQLARLLVRSASDAYFPQVLSVISLPDRGSVVRDAVAKVWENFLSLVEEAGELEKEKKRPAVKAALEGLTDEEVWTEIERRRTGAPAQTEKIKEVELATLLSVKEKLGDDVHSGHDFLARRLPLEATTGPMMAIERVVLVDRLREVTAQVGFTRFEAQTADIDGELSLDVRTAPLAAEVKWVPAVENRGEGIFLALDPARIGAWLERPGVVERGSRLSRGFERWKAAHRKPAMPFPGLPYVLLHSLSHLLLTAVSLDCGYATSSIRERIYVGDEAFGILLYTSSPDAEGTLGGLVEVGRNLGRHLGRALDLARLCASDPVCAMHRPDSGHEERFLTGAACHGCLLVPEPSCENRNDFLDRALVVPTVLGGDAAFFAGDLA